MFLETDFEFDGVRGSDIGLSLVQTSSGMIESPFGISQTIIEDKIRTIDIPFFYGVERNPITFPLTFAITDLSMKWDAEKRKEIGRLFFQKEYKPLISLDNPTVVYYIIAIDEATRYDNGANQGYITINVRMVSPYAYSYPVQLDTYDLSDATSHTIEMINKSNIKDYNYYPIFEFTLTGTATDITLTNLDDSGRQLTFAGLTQGETIYVDNQRGEIISSTNLSRLSKCNRKWFRLIYGINRIQISTNSGGVILRTKMQFPLAL